ncbi:MAG: hypothetical protein KatS3mg102_2272 [Planctomycetota bacterium]|nr:MAG: hypothetical protein KatS3mg102_2272 [Planctomycetota bacterium]
MRGWVGVRDIVVDYHQQGEGVPEGGKRGKLRLADRSLDLQMHLPCANPACKKGGFLLRREVERLVEQRCSQARLELPCAGYTGPLRAAVREGAPPARCGNRLVAEVRLVYGGPGRGAAPGAGDR